MKKLLLSMVAALTMAFGAAAAETTISGDAFSAGDNELTASKDGFSVVVKKNNGATAPALNTYDGVTTVRVYAKGTITVSGTNIQKVEFTLNTSTGYKRYAALTANPAGTMTTQKACTSADDMDTNITWTGDASSVTFTVGDKADYGTESSKAGQIHFLSIKVTGEGGEVGGGEDPEPNPDLTGNGTEASPYTVADAFKVIDAGAPEDKVYVTGEIVSIKEVSTSYGNATYDIADAAGATQQLTVYRGFYLGGEKFTAEDQIKVGDKVVVLGKLVLYGSTYELNTGNQLVSINGSTTGGEDPEPGPEPEAVKVNSVKEIIALADETKFETTFTLQVGFKNNRNVFVCDEAGDFIQIYGDNELNNGDVIPAGLVGLYKLYNGNQPEIMNAVIPAATAGTFTPKTVAASAINLDLVNNVVKIAKVELAEATPADQNNFTGTSEGTDLTFRNQYKLESVEAGTYDITVVVTVYQGNVQLYVVNYEKSDNSGIADIAAEEAAAEYFNLQGVRIANPAEGQIVIRRQGSKVEKILVK